MSDVTVPALGRMSIQTLILLLGLGATAAVGYSDGRNDIRHNAETNVAQDKAIEANRIDLAAVKASASDDRLKILTKLTEVQTELRHIGVGLAELQTREKQKAP